jgi:hypothetical protein
MRSRIAPKHLDAADNRRSRIGVHPITSKLLTVFASFTAPGASPAKKPNGWTNASSSQQHNGRYDINEHFFHEPGEICRP